MDIVSVDCPDFFYNVNIFILIYDIYEFILLIFCFMKSIFYDVINYFYFIYSINFFKFFYLFYTEYSIISSLLKILPKIS